GPVSQERADQLAGVDHQGRPQPAGAPNDRCRWIADVEAGAGAHWRVEHRGAGSRSVEGSASETLTAWSKAVTSLTAERDPRWERIHSRDGGAGDDCVLDVPASPE
nr:hypothetical protein [Tanacetum cinerariifolium]